MPAPALAVLLRHLAERLRGCHVEGVDLTPDFVEAVEPLSERSRNGGPPQLHWQGGYHRAPV